MNFFENFDDLAEENFDTSFEAFISLAQKVIDKHAPIKQTSRKQRKLKSKPWITKGIYSSICMKNPMHKSYYASGDEATKHEYKVYANKVTKLKFLQKKGIVLKN